MGLNSRGIQVDINTIIGMTVDEAKSALANQFYGIRVVEKDGERFAVTMDYDLNRLNVIVEDDKITAIESRG